MEEREIENRLTRLETRMTTIEQTQSDVTELVAAMKLLAQREETTEKTVTEIRNDVKELKNKPAKLWDSVVEKLIMAFVGAIAGVIIAKFGM